MFLGGQRLFTSTYWRKRKQLERHKLLDGYLVNQDKWDTYHIRKKYDFFDKLTLWKMNELWKFIETPDGQMLYLVDDMSEGGSVLERERGKIEGRWINGRWKQILVATTWHSTLLCDTEDVLYRVYRTRALLQEVGKCILSCNGKSKTPQKWNWYEVGKMNLMFRQIIKFMVWYFCFFRRIK